MSDYTSIYVQPFLTISQRKLWESFIQNSSIFIPDYIYEPETYGVQLIPKLYLEYGLQQLNLGDFAPALEQNFYQKRIKFGKVKTAKANDNSGQHVYDVVYVEMLDDLDGAKQTVVMNNRVYHPSSIENMRKSIRQITVGNGLIGYHPSALPAFMRTVQTGAYKPLGYVKAVILCYAKPGNGSRIVSRIRSSKFDLNDLTFEFNRINVENSLDNSTDKYLLFPELSITDNH